MRVWFTLVLWFATWLLWSGFYSPLLIILGVLSCLLTLIIALRMGFFEHDHFSLHLTGRLIPFWGWLGKELVLSNIRVARIVLSPQMKISPTVVNLQALPKDRVSQAILGNAITLTPGTVTIDDYEGQLIVHCLTRSGARELQAGEMNRRVTALER